MESESAIRGSRNDRTAFRSILVDADAATTSQIEGDFHKVVSRIALVVVHHTSGEGHAVIIISGAAHAELLIDFHIHFMVLVVPRSANHLESFVKAIRDESGAINILLEVGGDRGRSLRSGDHAISETATAKQVEFLVAIIEGHRGRGGSLQGVKRRSTAHSKGGAALGDNWTGGAANRANAHNHVLALYQFSGMVEHERKSSAMKRESD